MATHRVFICYSRNDTTARERFLIHLHPLERHENLLTWSDEKIQAGDDWQKKIYDSIEDATAAVVLLSPDLLASTFVVEEELPRLFRARSERDLLLTTLFVSASSFNLVKIPVDGTEYRLDELQGLHDPKDTLASSGDGDALLQTAAINLYDALRSRNVTTRRDRPRKELYVELQLRNGHVLRRTGIRPPYLDATNGRCDFPQGRLEGLPVSDDAYGRLLFEILMGDEEEMLKALSIALQKEIYSPDRYAFRIRIVCRDAELLELPWSLCRSRENHALVDAGWTFELATRSEPPPPLELPSPCRVLFVSPGADASERLHVGNHLLGFQGLLERAWDTQLKPAQLRHVTGRDALRQALKQEHRLVYVYTHGDASNRTLQLDDGTVTLDELAQWLDAHPPQAVVLNTPEDVPLMPELRRTGVCLQLRGDGDSERARRHGLQWWLAVLQDDQDPARAFGNLPREARQRGVLRTHFQTWKHEHSDVLPKVDRARAHLDRRDQRRVAREAVEELVRSPSRRLTCLVVYGAEGNLVHHFAEQLDRTLKEQATKVARLIPHRIRLPKQRGDLSLQEIRDAFRESSELQPLDGLDVAYQRRARGHQAKPVHFFNWGTFPFRDVPKLELSDLDAWIQFCRDELAGACPKTDRGLAYLSLVTPEDVHPQLSRWLAKRVEQLDSRHFTLVPLPALGHVEARDLLHFLLDENNSSCPRDLVRELPARIVEQTEGSFEKTVQWLETTERSNGWWDAAEDLPEVDTDEDDDDFEL